MSQLILHILPIAAAIALEPVCVLAALVMTATTRPLADSMAYLGALAGDANDDAVQAIWLLIGVGFLVAFAVLLLRRPRGTVEQREAVWTRRISATGPLGAAVVGLFLVNWEMETPALTVILRSRVPTGQAIAVLVLSTAIALSTSAVPVTAYLASPGGVGGRLDRMKAWLGSRERPIMLGLFLVIGVAFTWWGAKGLLSG